MVKRAIAGLLVACLAFGGVALGQSGSDKASDGTFTGLALITDDPAWYELFQRPETPEINGRSVFAPGTRGALALIFSNAESRDGNAKVECDITAFYPEGERVVMVEGGICYEGPYHGDNILHPALVDLQFEVEVGDPVGQAGFEVTLRDTNSDRSVALTVAYTQEQAE